MQKFDLEVDFRGFRVYCTYYPATPDVFYLPNGDPGYPGDPADYAVRDVKKDGVSVNADVEFFPQNDAEIEAFDEALSKAIDEAAIKYEEEYWKNYKEPDEEPEEKW